MPEDRMKHLLKSLFALFSLLYVGCSNNNTAGTTSETENEIAVRVVMPNGSPVASARVYLVDMTHFDSLVTLGKNPRQDSAQTNAQGVATLRFSKKILQKNILVQSVGFAGLIKNPTAADSVVSLAQSGSLRGTMNALAGSFVVLDGVGLSTTLALDGSFVINNIPQGNFAMLVSANEAALTFAGGVQIDTNMTTVTRTLEDGMLIDDFDNGTGIPQIRAFGAGSKWYVYNDGAGTTIAPTGVDSNITRAFLDSNAWKGKSLGLTIKLDTVIAAPYGSLACHLGIDSGKGRVDLSTMDSISFWIKGSGLIRIFFASDYIHTKYPTTQAGADLGFNVVLPSVWTRISIPTDSLLPPVGTTPRTDGVVWSMVSQSIDLLGLGTWSSPGQTVNFTIDDIRLHGVSPTTFR